MPSDRIYVERTALEVLCEVARGNLCDDPKCEDCNQIRAALDRVAAEEEEGREERCPNCEHVGAEACELAELVEDLEGAFAKLPKGGPMTDYLDNAVEAAYHATPQGSKMEARFAVEAAEPFIAEHHRAAERLKITGHPQGALAHAEEVAAKARADERARVEERLSSDAVVTLAGEVADELDLGLSSEGAQVVADRILRAALSAPQPRPRPSGAGAMSERVNGWPKITVEGYEKSPADVRPKLIVDPDERRSDQSLLLMRRTEYIPADSPQVLSQQALLRALLVDDGKWLAACSDNAAVVKWLRGAVQAAWQGRPPELLTLGEVERRFKDPGVVQLALAAADISPADLANVVATLLEALAYAEDPTKPPQKGNDK